MTSATTRGFSGHEMIDSMCLTDMNARMYDQTMGRFLSADNVDFDPGNGQDLNPYAYVDGQPTVFTDLTGNIEQVVVDHPLLPQDKVNGVPMPAGTADAVESVIGGTGAPGTGENVVVTGHRRHQEPLGGFAINPSPFGFLIDVSVFGGSGGTKQDMLCNNANAVSFVKHHEADAAAVAQQLQVPTSFVLGLSAAESQYGTNRFSRLGNNFFSLQGNASSPFANGSMQAQNSSAQLSTFPSYAASAQSFAAQYGAGVRGADTPEQFAQDLVDEVFNTANAETGGDPHFVSKTASVINSVARRMKC
ncbi:MAG TPA: RHS repeat-associated core domain-containing protein [Rhizomicrobium sp.]|nr:RHS repeat-associated core domain-containing protein [Rhizomicrobium sp.]